MSNRIRSLDGLRAIAIGLVILGHRDMAGAVPYAVDSLLAYVQPGVTGVRVFFIISGFLITTLLLAELDRADSVNLGRFYFRRTFRLLPALVAYVAGIVVLQKMGLVQLAPGDVMHAVTYTTNYHEGRWYLQHTWTLSIEEQFYLLWPAILVFAGKRRATWIACAVVLAGPFIKLAIMGPVIPNAIDHSAFTFRGVSDTLAAGCALALLRPQLHKTWLYCRSIESPVMALAPIVCVLSWSALGNARVAAVTQLASVVLFTLFIDRVITFRTASTRVLNAAPVAWLGRISYSVYLWQMLFTAPSAMDPWQSLAISQGMWRYAGILGAAVLSYYAVELPFLRLRDAIERAFSQRVVVAETDVITTRVATESAIPRQTPTASHEPVALSR